MMKPRISLFAEHEREVRRTTIGDPLVGLTKHVDFEALAASIDAAAPRPSRAKGGRPPYPTVLMIKIMVLQQLYNLADDALEYQLLDRRSFLQFLDLTESSSIPDAKTIWLFRERLAQAGAGTLVFEQVQRQLQQHGYMARCGQIVDASLVQAPVQRNKREEAEIVKDGTMPLGWKAYKRAQKDVDARWTKKHGKSYFGYPILYLDCIHVKVRDSGAVRTKAVYLAIGVNMDGHKEVLGLWISQTEGAKFWLQVVTELKNRGVQDIFIACVDGLKGFPEAIEAVYPQATVQLCIVHMVRNSLNFVPWKAQKEVAADLKLIYGAATAEKAELRLSEFEEKWDKQYKPIGQSWRRNWARVIPFFDYPPEICKVSYTTNAIESINMSLRKVTKARNSFPTDEAVSKLFYLALNNISKKWTMRIRDWKAALNRFAIQFEDRVPQA